jgi:hypothetical protein
MDRRRLAFPIVLAGICCVVLCGLFALELSLAGPAVRACRSTIPGALLPIATIEPGPLNLRCITADSATRIEAIRIAELLTLATLRLLSSRWRLESRVPPFLVAGAALMMAFLALEARVSESADMYLYVGLAQATPSAYHPGTIAFAGDVGAINRLWGLPLMPSAYGPLWLALSKAALAFAPTLAEKLITLRVLGLSAVALCTYTLWLLGVPRIVIMLFALNPAVYELFVVEAHNDLTGVVLILAAAVVRPRSRIAALALCAAAGAIKLPFILIGMLVFASETTLAKRVSYALLSAVLSVVISFSWAGPWYPWALKRVQELGGNMGPPLEFVVHVAIAAFVVGAIFVAVTRRRFVIGAPWAMPALGPIPLPHYLAWSLPAVFLDPKPKWAFLATMPLMAFLLDTSYQPTALTVCLLILAVLAVVLIAFRVPRRWVYAISNP